MSSYSSQEYLVELKSALEVYLSSTIEENLKPKRENAIRKAYDGVYDIQLAAITSVNNIQVSQLLAVNDIAVESFVAEYGELAFILKHLDGKLKGLNQFNEMKTALSGLKDALKTKELGKHLFNDLEFLANSYDLDIDIKASVDAMKKFQADEKLQRQLGIA